MYHACFQLNVREFKHILEIYHQVDSSKHIIKSIRTKAHSVFKCYSWALHLTWQFENVVTVTRWWQLLEISTGEKPERKQFFNLIHKLQRINSFFILSSSFTKCSKCKQGDLYYVFAISIISFDCFIYSALLYDLVSLSLRGFFHKKLNFYCEHASGFGGTDGVQSSDIDKKQAATRQSAPCGKLKCQTRKNLCIAYTQVNTHAHFFFPALCVFFFFSMKVFHTEDTHLRCEPPDMMTAKVHLINSWQAHARALWYRKWSDYRVLTQSKLQSPFMKKELSKKKSYTFTSI